MVYFKIMPFWVTSWPFKKILYDVVSACNYGMSIAIWWCFNTWFLFSDKPYCIRRVRQFRYASVTILWQISHLMPTFSPFQTIKCILKAFKRLKLLYDLHNHNFSLSDKLFYVLVHFFYGLMSFYFIHNSIETLLILCLK